MKMKFDSWLGVIGSIVTLGVFFVNNALAIQPQVVDAGQLVVCLKSDGTVLAVGVDRYNVQSEISGWTNIIQIAAAVNSHVVGLRSDGTVVAVGNNDYGQLDVSHWTDIIQVAAGSNQTVGLRNDGTVVAAWYDGPGQLEISNWTNIIQIAAGPIGLKSDGTVVATENLANGISDWTDIIQISDRGPVGLKRDGTVVPTSAYGGTSNWTDIIQVAYSIGLKSDGTVVIPDDPRVGQRTPKARAVSVWDNIIQVDSKTNNVVGLKNDGSVVAVNNQGNTPYELRSWTDIVQLDATGHTYGVKNDGTLLMTTANRAIVPEWTDIVQVSKGVGLKNNGTVVAIDESVFEGESGVRGWLDVIQIASDGQNVIGLKSDGTVVTTSTSDSDIISEWSDIIQVCARWRSSGTTLLGLKNDGTVVTTEPNWMPAVGSEIGGWTGIIQLAASRDVVGLRSDGTVIVAGGYSNSDGHLDVSGWTDITQVSISSHHTVGLRRDGTVVAVGNNDYGQLDVSDWTGITQVSAGGRHTVGLRRDGTVVAVGDNGNGQCGLFRNLLLSHNYQIAFFSRLGGSIEGKKFQTINLNENCTAVQAIPKQGFEFSGWSGDYNGTENPLSVTNITENMEIYANFVPLFDDLPDENQNEISDDTERDNQSGIPDVEETYPEDDQRGTPSSGSGGGCFILILS